jgi:hypothetical protein
MLRPLSLALVLVAVLLSTANIQPPSARAQAPAGVRLVPTKIKPNDSYQVTGLIWDGAPYSGPLEYQLRRCDLAFAACAEISGLWAYQAVDGAVTVPGGQSFPTGAYIVRFRKPGAAYSNSVALLVDSFETYYGPAPTSGAPVISPPVPGSISVFTRPGASDIFASVAIESDACPLSAYIPAGTLNTRNQRITKSAELMYWNGYGPEAAMQYRWCVGDVPAPSASDPQYYAFAPLYVETWYSAPEAVAGQTVDMANVARRTIAVTYPDSGSATPGLLGGLRLNPAAPAAPPSVANFRTDMVDHYSLLPRDRMYPVLSGAARQVIHEFTFGWDSSPALYGSGLFNLWHSEALAPTAPGAVVRMRYIERGVSFDNPATPAVEPATPRWSVVEDWEWGADGAVLKITQWGLTDPTQIPALCWRGSGYNPASPGTSSDACVAGLTPSYVLNLAEYASPVGAGPLSARLYDPAGGERDASVAIPAGGAYQLELTWPDGKPYSGFLEITRGDAAPALLRDQNNRPIYVHRGKVRIGPATYGNLIDTTLRFTLRPYLTNSSLDSLVPNAAPRPNDLAPGFLPSEQLTLVISPLPSRQYLPQLSRP